MLSVFERIICGELAADKLFEDDKCIVINDIHPQAPVHFLVIPKKKLVSLMDAKACDQALLGHLLVVAAQVAEQLGLKGYRLVANNGQSAGQTVMHLHFHVLGRKTLSEQGLI
ncbi:MAG: histidine triad nucleotide-binding protein [Cellvibrionales bacterium]|nr:histidine triad nucleotide-binding protein [Cellvibrionales bacterium]